MESKKEIEDQIKGLLGLNLGEVGTLPPMKRGGGGGGGRQHGGRGISQGGRGFSQAGQGGRGIAVLKPGQGGMQPFGRGAARTGTGATGRSPAPAPGGYPHPPSKLARPRHAETTYQSENTDRKTRKKSMVNSVESVDTGAKNGLDNKEMEMLQLLVRESSIEASREKIKESFTPSEELLKYLHGKLKQKRCCKSHSCRV